MRKFLNGSWLVGHLIISTANILGNLTKIFQKSLCQHLAGRGYMGSFRIDWYIKNTVEPPLTPISVQR